MNRFKTFVARESKSEYDANLKLTGSKVKIPKELDNTNLKLVDYKKKSTGYDPYNHDPTK
jgi:hypothetical protein